MGMSAGAMIHRRAECEWLHRRRDGAAVWERDSEARETRGAVSLAVSPSQFLSVGPSRHRHLRTGKTEWRYN